MVGEGVVLRPGKLIRYARVNTVQVSRLCENIPPKFVVASHIVLREWSNQRILLDCESSPAWGGLRMTARRAQKNLRFFLE